MKITQELLSYVQQNVIKYEHRLLQGEKVEGLVLIEPGQHLNPDFLVLQTLATMCFPESSFGIHFSSSSIFSRMGSHAPITSMAI